jgi:hypothetical protein
MSLRRIGRRRYNILNRGDKYMKERPGKESIKGMCVWEVFCKLWD